MDTALLFIHILGAGAWLGANFTQAVVTPLMRRRGGDAAASWMRATVAMGTRLYSPSAVVVLVTGIWMVIRSSVYDFEQAFVVIGIAAVLVGAFLGIRVFGPRGEELAELHESGAEEPELAAAHAALMRFGAFETAVIVFAIWAMVSRLGT